MKRSPRKKGQLTLTATVYASGLAITYLTISPLQLEHAYKNQENEIKRC